MVSHGVAEGDVGEGIEVNEGIVGDEIDHGVFADVANSGYSFYG